MAYSSYPIYLRPRSKYFWYCRISYIILLPITFAAACLSVLSIIVLTLADSLTEASYKE